VRIKRTYSVILPFAFVNTTKRLELSNAVSSIRHPTSNILGTVWPCVCSLTLSAVALPLAIVGRTRFINLLTPTLASISEPLSLIGSRINVSKYTTSVFLIELCQVKQGKVGVCQNWFQTCGELAKRTKSSFHIPSNLAPEGCVHTPLPLRLLSCQAPSYELWSGQVARPDPDL
jgi:hypothetical protein